MAAEKMGATSGEIFSVPGGVDEMINGGERREE